MRIAFYLADQNPERDRSLGITAYTLGLLRGLARDFPAIELMALMGASAGVPVLPKSVSARTLSWRTTNAPARLLTDQLVAPFWPGASKNALAFFPKGYLPAVLRPRRPCVATIHDTIVQHYSDFYSGTRRPLEASYLAWTMRQSLNRADLLITDSQFTKGTIEQVAQRFRLRPPSIVVTGVGSDFEEERMRSPAQKIQQVVHLASPLPHKRTKTLLQFWAALVQSGKDLPRLKLIGRLESTAVEYLNQIPHATIEPHCTRTELVDILRESSALIVPSEIEGFGLPSLESYYCGTPVVFVRETVAEELIAIADARRCGFELDSVESFGAALDVALGLSKETIQKVSEDMFRRFNWRDVTKRTVDAFLGVNP